jgi:hypothetical protein
MTTPRFGRALTLAVSAPKALRQEFPPPEWTLPDRGVSEMLNEAGLQRAWIQAALLSSAVFFAFNSLFSLVWNRRSGGQWCGRQFVYDEPRHLHTVYVSADDNDKAFPIRVPGALPGAYAKFKIEIDRSDTRVKATLNLAPAHAATVEYMAPTHTEGMRLSSRRPIFLVPHCAPEATSTCIRVYLLSVTYADEIPVRET